MQKQDKVIEMIAEQLNIEQSKLTLETRVKEDLKADSLDMAEMLMNFEEEFDFLADEEMFSKIKTIGDVVKYIESL